MTALTYAENPTETKKYDGDYRILRERLNQAGVFEKQPGYYLLAFTVTLGLFASTIAVLIFASSLWPVAALLAVFASTQLGFLAHDSQHRQIAADARSNDMLVLPF